MVEKASQRQQVKIARWSPEKAERMFLKRFNQLYKERGRKK